MVSIASIRIRASSTFRTGVLPFFCVYFGPRTMQPPGRQRCKVVPATHFTRIQPPVSDGFRQSARSQSLSCRKCRFTGGTSNVKDSTLGTLAPCALQLRLPLRAGAPLDQMSTSPEPVPASTTNLNSPLAGLCVFGPRAGYSHQVSILVSQLDWMRRCVLIRLQGLTQEDLDWLPSPDGNTIGALLLHLAATETYYQFHTFEGLPWANTSPETKKRFGPAMKLGDLGRRLVKGHELTFYLDTLAEVRERTLLELRKRDDAWLMAVDESWFWGPTSNLCKWFHVCEHESHHLGQIDLHLKSLRRQMLESTPASATAGSNARS